MLEKNFWGVVYFDAGLCFCIANVIQYFLLFYQYLQKRFQVVRSDKSHTYDILGLSHQDDSILQRLCRHLCPYALHISQ